jgi:DNA-binding SARP family transcriptional activator
VREDEAYRLRLPAGARVDVADFDAAVARGHAARARGDLTAAAVAYEAALAAYRGELLPEEGPAEWVVAEREARRTAAARAALSVAEGLLARGQPLAAATACESGLAVDRCDDDLWRLCTEAYERAGDRAAAARTREGYARVLRELGIELGSPAP